MANEEISQLTELTTPATGDQFAIVDASEALLANQNKRIDYRTLFPDYNVQHYGALGDGVTDDAAAIQAAIDAAEAAEASTVFFPNGIYLIGSQLTAEHVHLVGATDAPIEANTVDQGPMIHVIRS